MDESDVKPMEKVLDEEHSESSDSEDEWVLDEDDDYLDSLPLEEQVQLLSLYFTVAEEEKKLLEDSLRDEIAKNERLTTQVEELTKKIYENEFLENRKLKDELEVLKLREETISKELTSSKQELEQFQKEIQDLEMDKKILLKTNADPKRSTNATTSNADPELVSQIDRLREHHQDTLVKLQQEKGRMDNMKQSLAELQDEKNKLFRTLLEEKAAHAHTQRLLEDERKKASAERDSVARARALARPSGDNKNIKKKTLRHVKKNTLPRGWEARTDSQGKLYYFNVETNAVSELHPLLEEGGNHVRNMVKSASGRYTMARNSSDNANLKELNAAIEAAIQ